MLKNTLSIILLTSFFVGCSTGSNTRNSPSTYTNNNSQLSLYDAAKLVKEKKYKQAIPMLTKYSLNGNAKAQYLLGILYRDSKEYSLAHFWLKKASDQNNAGALNELARMYAKGLGVTKSYEKSFKLYARSAALGDELGQYNTAHSYYFGYGVKRDYNLAFKYYLMSAKKNVAQAQKDLALLYARGEGVPKNLPKARYWSEKATNAMSQYKR